MEIEVKDLCDTEFAKNIYKKYGKLIFNKQETADILGVSPAILKTFIEMGVIKSIGRASQKGQAYSIGDIIRFAFDKNNG